jgi:tetratricopeptide (TPR) repeat protein
MLSLMNPLPYNKQLQNKCHAMTNWVAQLFAVGLILVLTGCTPPGVNALLEGKGHLDKGDIQKAITAFKKATNFMPESARAWNYLGMAYHRDGQFIAARDAYDKSWNKDNNLAQAKFNQGCLMLETGQYGLAISRFKTFQMLSPQSQRFFRNWPWPIMVRANWKRPDPFTKTCCAKTKNYPAPGMALASSSFNRVISGRPIIISAPH